MTALHTKLIRSAASLLLGAFVVSSCSTYEFDYLYEDLPFEMAKVQRPQIPAREISVADFGGVGDGVALNTEAFAKAIETLSQYGGGRVTVPTGVWLTGPITLKDNIELHIKPDAVLLLTSSSWAPSFLELLFTGRQEILQASSHQILLL